MDKIEKIQETLIIEIDKKFNAKQYRLMDKDELADIELRVSGGKIGLSISKWDEEVCRIEYFFYWSKDDNESILTDMYKLCIILKQLYVITGNLVDISFHESADEKDVRIELYHDVRKFEVQSIMYILETYNRVDLRDVNIDKNFIEENYLELFDLFQRKSMEIKMYFKQIIESKIYDKISSLRYREVISEIFSEEDFVYTIYNQKIHVGFSQEGIERYINKYHLNLKDMPDYYEGIKYNIMTEDGNICIWKKDLWSEVSNWLKILELTY